MPKRRSMDTESPRAALKPVLAVEIGAIVDSADAMFSYYVQRRMLSSTLDPAAKGGDDESSICPDDEGAVWDRLADISAAIAGVPAKTMGDIRAKIRLWRLLAPESTFDEDEQTPDETLLCSFIDDLERLTRE